MSPPTSYSLHTSVQTHIMYVVKTSTEFNMELILKDLIKSIFFGKVLLLLLLKILLCTYDSSESLHRENIFTEAIQRNDRELYATLGCHSDNDLRPFGYKVASFYPMRYLCVI